MSADIDVSYRPPAGRLIAAIVILALAAVVLLVDFGVEDVAMPPRGLGWASAVVAILFLIVLVRSRSHRLRITNTQLQIDTLFKRPGVVLPLSEITEVDVLVYKKHRHIVVVSPSKKLTLPQAMFAGESDFERVRERLLLSTQR